LACASLGVDNLCVDITAEEVPTLDGSAASFVFLLLVAVTCFVFYIGIGLQRYRSWGLKVLKWTLVAAFGFFAVLILERLA